jgi:hypothetical protein
MSVSQQSRRQETVVPTDLPHPGPPTGRFSKLLQTVLDSPVVTAPARAAGQVVRQAGRVSGAAFRLVTGRAPSHSADPAAEPTPVALPPEKGKVAAELRHPGEGVLPVAHYDELNATDAITAIRTLTDLAQVQAIGRHERNNKDRVSVVNAVEARVAELSERSARS